nr:hypothetical protein [Tanacetum cinerariifolium]
MLVVRDVAEEAEAQVLAQGDDVQEPAAEEVVIEVVPPTLTPPSPPSPVLDICSALARRVEGLENDKAAQRLEIVKLEARVKKLEKINKVQEAVEIVTTAKLMTEVVTATATQDIAASIPIPAAKPKILNITAAPAVSTRRRKGVSREEMEEEDEEIIKSINETPA